jgi:hypothetical protein
MFKSGDKVICIDDKLSDLAYGGVYTVHYCIKGTVILIGDSTNWNINRFAPNTTASKILYLK